MILHMISKSPYQHSAFTDACTVVSQDDAILFIEDGIYAALPSSPYLEQLKKLGCECYVLAQHAEARGATLDASIQAITLPQMVALTLQYSKTISWY